MDASFPSLSLNIHTQFCRLPWRVSTGLVDRAEVVVVQVLPVMDLDSGEPPPSLEPICISRRSVSVDCKTHTCTHTQQDEVSWYSLVKEVKGRENDIYICHSVGDTYSNALIVRKVHSILVFCVNQVEKDHNINTHKRHHIYI